MRVRPGFFIAALLMTCFAVNAQSDSLDWNTAIAPHPRILMREGEEAEIKTNIQQDKIWMKIHTTILDECDKMLNEPALQRVQIGRRILVVSRECLRRVFFLSYAWRMTHEEKYFKKAESELLSVSSFTDWNPSHFLDVAEMTMALSIGYDWLYNNLSQQSRSLIKEAILKKGIEQSLDRKYNGWLTGTNNWNQVCNAGISFGVLAIYDDIPQLAPSLINRAIKTIDLPMHEAYAPDGAYPEGYAYWGYGTSFNVLFISALEKLFGRDFGLSQKQGFLKTATYMENMTAPTGEAFNYSDSGPGWEPQPAMVWFAQKLKDPSLLLVERNKLTGDKTHAIKKERLLPAFMVWGAGMGFDKVQPPAANMFVGAGRNPIAIMRTSWTDPNAIFVGLKTGTPNFSHAHMDIGSFIMEADGVRWAMDFGPQAYETLEMKGVDLWHYQQNAQRWQVFRYNNFVHNTLTVNNNLQNASGVAVINGYSSAPLFMNATTDLSDMYKSDLSKVNRGIAIVNNSYVTVRDEVATGDKEATIRWTMLTPANVKILSTNKAELTRDGKKLVLQVAEPAAIHLITWPTAPLHDYDAPNPGTLFVGFEVKVPANSKQPITVLLLPEKVTKGAVEKVKPLEEWVR